MAKHPSRAHQIVVMGVSGAGKSTIGQLLAKRSGADFLDGDALHPPENVALMAAGVPLDDESRKPWLDAVGQALRDAREAEGSLVVACSALKRSYRDLIRSHCPETQFVFLAGAMHTIHPRITAREHEFMPPTLLASQFLTLQPLAADEPGITLDVRSSPTRLVEEALDWILGSGTLSTAPAYEQANRS